MYVVLVVVTQGQWLSSPIASDNNYDSYRTTIGNWQMANQFLPMR